MSIDILDPEYQWKEAASQEGVDYGAVQKSFMDQSYGVVANKAKVLFQDPFRLGFEIVHRNEKATKMVGIFAFRVNKDLLYAPTFFVNGEIKAADMLYRADVKRFVPLTEEWCSYLVRGVHESSGRPVDKNRMRQTDAYMDRLASPQRVKYASEEDFALTKVACDERLANAVGEDGYDIEKVAMDNPGIDLLAGMSDEWAAEMAEARDAFVKSAADGSLWNELLTHSADFTPLRKLLPEVINEQGPDALLKVASFVEGSPDAARYLARNYTREELESVDAWMSKEASAPQPAIEIIMDPSLAKSAAERESIFDKGYELVDKRPADYVNTVIEEVGDGTIKELSAPGKVSIMLDSGEMEEALLMRCDEELLECCDNEMASSPAYDNRSKVEMVYFPKTKELLRLGHGQDVFGDEMIDQDSSASLVDANDLKEGKCYAAVSSEVNAVSRVFKVTDKKKDGDCTCICTVSQWGGDGEIYYAPGRNKADGRYISDETKFLEVKNKESDEDYDCAPAPGEFELVCDKVLMRPSGIDDWIRSAGGITSSRDVRVKQNKNGVTFDIEHSEGGTILKSARDLGMLEAHLKLAEDFSLTVDKAGEILDKAVDNDVTYRVYDTLSKEAYVTRMEGMEDWIESYDPELQVKLDAPQQQLLSTFTPKRPDEQSRYGDHYERVPAENRDDVEEVLPHEMIMSQSPEELAQLSEQYDLPHIFDHGAVGQMATNSHSINEQIKKYIPDIEAGVDRYFRILFLLRYRPADFEEMYGKDDLVDFEQTLADIAAQSGEALLKMLQRFTPDQYVAK